MPYTKDKKITFRKQIKVSEPRVRFTSTDEKLAQELSKIDEFEQLVVREYQLESFWQSVREKKDWRIRLEILIAYLEQDLYSQKSALLWYKDGKIKQFLISLRYLQSINYLELNRYIVEIERLVILAEWIS